MLFKFALLMLVVWLLGVLSVYDAGKLTHVFLLVGLLLLLLGVARARESAVRGDHPGDKR